MRTASGYAQTLPLFLALSLALHGLVLAAILTHHPSDPIVVIGGSELRIQMTSPESRHNTEPVASSHAFTAAAAVYTTQLDMETEQGAVPGDTEQLSAQPSAALENYLIGRLQTELSRHLVYPRLARERGWQGTVLVSVVLAPNGVVQGLRLVHSSGYFLLDEASLTGLRKLHTLSLAGGQRWTDPIEVMLPIRFQLIDNG